MVIIVRWYNWYKLLIIKHYNSKLDSINSSEQCIGKLEMGHFVKNFLNILPADRADLEDQSLRIEQQFL